MNSTIAIKTLLHISFSLAAFVFSIVLYILILVLGSGEQHKNLKFRTLTITIVIGNLLSILDNIFRDSGMFPTPVWIQLLLLLQVYLANILLTYYTAMYMEEFFGEFKHKKLFFRINSAIALSGVILTVYAYIRQFVLYDGYSVISEFPLILRIILGYAYELYFIIYCVVLFNVFKKTISERAQMTAVAAFFVAIGSILFESLNTLGLGSGILFNYFGAVIALYIFYIGVETPDYRNLLQSLSDLDSAKRSADDANRSKSDFLANMSHEIRTPINAILGMNEMILRESEDDTILTYAESIGNAGKTLLGLINDILDFSKIEAGKIDIIPVDYDLSAVLNDLVAMISPRAEKKGLALELDFDRDTPRFLRGDEVRIKQVITNILTNAVKYTEKGKVTFHVGFTLIDDPENVILTVSVKDTGIGIKPEDLSKLFSEFERIEEKRNRNIEGTGLGMSITKRLLSLMDSGLNVESTYGAGSTFSFSLKQQVLSWSNLGDYKIARRESLTNHRKYKAKFTAPEAKILVVDDNHMNLMVFKSLIKKTRVVTDTAESGDEALFLAAGSKYDVIFLDHMMPGKDGIETLHELRGTEGPNKETPSVCLTANAISGARDLYCSEGFEDYLTKPINPGELEDLLLHFIPDEKILVSRDSEDESESDTLPEELSPLLNSPIDPVEGMKNSGDKASYLALLKTFYDTAEKKTDELDGFFKKKDIEGYTILVHALKSSARIIGASSLGDKAEALEMAGKTGDIKYINEHHSDFLLEYRNLRNPLSEVLSRNINEKKFLPLADRNFLNKIYDDLRAAAEEYDTEQIDTVFELLSGYSIPENEEERIEKLRSAYEELDYSQILTLLPPSSGSL